MHADLGTDQPLVIHRQPHGADRAVAISRALLVGGGLLVAASLVWAVSTDLHPGLQLNSCSRA